MTPVPPIKEEKNCKVGNGVPGWTRNQNTNCHLERHYFMTNCILENWTYHTGLSLSPSFALRDRSRENRVRQTSG